MNDFVVGRNPAERTRLPYLLRVPLAGGDVVLATRDVWPRTGDLYCHVLESWPDGAEEVERVPVERCWRSGVAIHLVVRRRQERRSLFVWTRARGREMVFWRSAASMRAARPGVRVPGASGLERATFTVAVDTRERHPWRFARRDVVTERRSLPVGDYALLDGDTVVAAIERKRVPDLASSIVSGCLTAMLSELAQLPRSAIVVEARLGELLRHGERTGVAPGWLLNAVAALQVTHPRVSWMFCETRPLAEDWAFRWLSACVDGRRHHHEDVDEREPRPLVLRDAGARRQLVVEDAEGRGEWDIASLAERAGVSTATAAADLARLAAEGVVRRERRGRRVVYRYAVAAVGEGQAARGRPTT